MKNITSKDVKSENQNNLELHEKMCIMLNKPLVMVATMLTDKTMFLTDYSLN